MYNNKKFWFRKGLMFFFFIAAILLFTLIVMNLWNTILPAVLHVSSITFGQALGILILSKILFGGFHRGWGGRRGWRRHGMHERLANMTPEEREQFKAEWKDRCSSWRKKTDTPSGAAE